MGTREDRAAEPSAPPMLGNPSEKRGLAREHVAFKK